MSTATLANCLELLGFKKDESGKIYARTIQLTDKRSANMAVAPRGKKNDAGEHLVVVQFGVRTYETTTENVVDIIAKAATDCCMADLESYVKERLT